mmetsp:Transcript_35347/g.56427  ORF Transcript_35347/g.56427 Transcript_35347/m.56427 type:complete len:564 (+) Transcript_35347:384-2075(+)
MAPLNILRILAVNDVYTLKNLGRLRSCYEKKGHEIQRVLARRPDLCKEFNIESIEVMRTLAGDYLSPNVLSPIDNGYSFQKCFNAVGLTHYCFGNHEANLNIDDLQSRLNECSGEVLNSNIPSFDHPTLPRYDVINIGSRKVGVLGLLTNERKVFKNGTFKGYKIEDVIDTTRELEKLLRNDMGCDEVIALTHQSMEKDRELAAASGLLAIIGGHEHSPFDETVEGCRIIKTGKDAEVCGIVDLYIRERGSSRVKYYPETIAKYEPNTEVEELVDACMAVVKQLDDEILIDTGSYITSEGTRFRQTGIGSLLGDFIKAEMNTDVAMINGATIKSTSDFVDGKVSYSDLHVILPFPTKLISVEMPGKVLQDAVRYSRRKGEWNDEKRGFLQLDSGVEVLNPTVSGIYGEPDDLDDTDFIINVATDPFEHDSIININGEPFDPERMYNVALPRNLLKGFCEIKPLIKFGEQCPQAMPDGDNFIPALELVIRHCTRPLWNILGNFDELDVDGDNLISRKELRTRIKEVRGRPIPRPLLLELVDAVDEDHDGFISREEFEHILNSSS